MDGEVTIFGETPRSSLAREPREILVLGLGNTLLGDDGVGVHVVQCLARAPYARAGLRPLDGGTMGFRLMAAVMQTGSVLFVDAAQLGETAGTVRLLDGTALSETVRHSGSTSAHAAGLASLLTLAGLSGWQPIHLALLAIQPQRIGWGDELSDTVRQALPAACRMAIQTVRDWQAFA